MPDRYRKESIEVRAVQWTGKNGVEVVGSIRARLTPLDHMRHRYGG